MIEVLAQTYSSYDTTTLNSGASAAAGFALFSGVLIFIWLAVVIVAIVAMWKVFEKAGVEGWKAIIPVYNSWTLAEIAGKPGWWGLVPLVYLIPVIGWIFGWIAVLVVYVIIALELAKRFGKDTTFAILWLIIFSLVGMLMLGFGDAKYSGKPFKTLDQNNKPSDDKNTKA